MKNGKTKKVDRKLSALLYWNLYQKLKGNVEESRLYPGLTISNYPSLFLKTLWIHSSTPYTVSQTLTMATLYVLPIYLLILDNWSSPICRIWVEAVVWHTSLLSHLLSFLCTWMPLHLELQSKQCGEASLRFWMIWRSNWQFGMFCGKKTLVIGLFLETFLQCLTGFTVSFFKK